MNCYLRIIRLAACFVCLISGNVAAQVRCYGIRVVDEETRQGVPLIQLQTVHHVSFWTDSMGYIALNEADWFGRDVYFHVKGDGYEVSTDGFGNAGVRLRPEPGNIDEIVVRRTQAAERMYRITGADRYHHAKRLGVALPFDENSLDGNVVGQDSSQALVYRGRIHWFWGDTSIFRYPLGNFRTSGAFSLNPSNGGLSPDQGVALEYFVKKNGDNAEMCPMPPRGNLIWIDGLLTLEDEQGQERMVAHFSKRKSLAEQMEHGLVVFDDQSQRFRLLKKFENENTWQHPRGHPIRVTTDGRDYFVFGDVYYHIRVPAEWKSLQDPEAYESFGPSEPEETGYQWRKDHAPVSIKQEQAWIKAGTMPQSESWLLPLDVASGKNIVLHRGSVRWNAYRNKYIMIANQIGGDSMLGEVWYGESDHPEGPWRKVVKVAAHANYSYYNPVHREFFDKASGQMIYFEGTYTTTFSGNKHPVPRYDYNQLMYRLDLEDERLKKVR